MSTSFTKEIIENKIFSIRRQRVMVDRDLAELYQVETKYLNRQVRRNLERFPAEFMFRLNSKEKEELVTNCHRFSTLKHSSSLPYAFTEHGVLMLANVLKSDRAVKVSIEIVRIFIKLREFMKAHKDLARKLNEMEEKYDARFKVVFEAIRQLMREPEKPRQKIGF